LLSDSIPLYLETHGGLSAIEVADIVRDAVYNNYLFSVSKQVHFSFWEIKDPFFAPFEAKRLLFRR